MSVRTQSPTGVATPTTESTTTSTTISTPTTGGQTDVPLDMKIGQMLLVGFRGLQVNADHPIIQDIRERHLGGVVLFDYDVPSQSPVRNIASPQQVTALVAALQQAATIPLFVSVDQEGGKVARLNQQAGFPPTVSAQYLGRMNDTGLTRRSALTIAQTLHRLGINLNLAPVVDLNVYPNNPVIGALERSFSADPVIVTRQALAFIGAHHDQGVLCTLKHFPGHGSSTTDSHLGLVDVTKTWSHNELVPYAKLIQARVVDAIMTAHVFNAHLDPTYPATLSQPMISGLLRQSMDYDGVVISDDMQLGAITQHYGFEAALQTAINAGVDILTLGNNLVYEEGIAARMITLITHLVQDGKVSMARIDQSFQRIQRLKQRLAKTS
ncbi:MAG: glycoside hydrolase family 3 protein [Herpetosiphonaceae bacterium]|nr:glycoside hydrolase family 3 protein [Herpetosiphonaceae bacterium]